MQLFCIKLLIINFPSLIILTYTLLTLLPLLIMKQFVYLLPIILVACGSTSDNVIPIAEDADNTEIHENGDTTNMADTDMNPEDANVYISVKNTTEADILTINVGDEITEIILPTEAEGETEAYQIPGGDDTVAVFHNYFAGGGDVFYVHHTGTNLIVKTMGVDEPDATGTVGCNPWEEIAKVDIGLAQIFTVQGGIDLKPSTGIACDCKDNGEGYVCM